MTILKIEPGRKPVTEEINGDLKSMQEIVGGYIQAIYPFEEPVALLCNEEAKLLGLPYNRTLSMEGQPYDIVCGTFFLCNAPPDSESFESLNEVQLKKYADLFKVPEVFIWTERGLRVFKYVEEKKND